MIVQESSRPPPSRRRNTANATTWGILAVKGWTERRSLPGLVRYGQKVDDKSTSAPPRVRLNRAERPARKRADLMMKEFPRRAGLTSKSIWIQDQIPESVPELSAVEFAGILINLHDKRTRWAPRVRQRVT
jgi:hypothetical protein